MTQTGQRQLWELILIFGGQKPSGPESLDLRRETVARLRYLASWIEEEGYVPTFRFPIEEKYK